MKYHKNEWSEKRNKGKQTHKTQASFLLLVLKDKNQLYQVAEKRSAWWLSEGTGLSPLTGMSALGCGLLPQLTDSVALVKPSSVQPRESHNEESVAAAAAAFDTEPNLGATDSWMLLYPDLMIPRLLESRQRVWGHFGGGYNLILFASIWISILSRVTIHRPMGALGYKVCTAFPRH